jgi:hypothetical protein
MFVCFGCVLCFMYGGSLLLQALVSFESNGDYEVTFFLYFCIWL